MSTETAAYAANLRQNLLQELFEGEDALDAVTEEDMNISDLTMLLDGSELTLQDVDKDLEQYGNHDIIRGILEQGRVLTEYARDVDDKLRQTEMDAIQVGLCTCPPALTLV